MGVNERAAQFLHMFKAWPVTKENRSLIILSKYEPSAMFYQASDKKISSHAKWLKIKFTMNNTVTFL